MWTTLRHPSCDIAPNSVSANCVFVRLINCSDHNGASCLNDLCLSGFSHTVTHLELRVTPDQHLYSRLPAPAQTSMCCIPYRVRTSENTVSSTRLNFIVILLRTSYTERMYSRQNCGPQTALYQGLVDLIWTGTIDHRKVLSMTTQFTDWTSSWAVTDLLNPETDVGLVNNAELGTAP